jgi:hypothetical protein
MIENLSKEASVSYFLTGLWGVIAAFSVSLESHWNDGFKNKKLYSIGVILLWLSAVFTFAGVPLKKNEIGLNIFLFCMYLTSVILIYLSEIRKFKDDIKSNREGYNFWWLGQMLILTIPASFAISIVKSMLKE